MTDPESFDAHFARLEKARAAGPRHGPGRALAVVVVDFQRYFVDHDPAAVDALLATADLLATARANGVPVFHTAVVIDSPDEIDPAWAARHDLSGLYRGAPTAAPHPLVAPSGGDVVIEKKHASAFLRTGLEHRLARAAIDTVLLCGTSTSGCVRATAVDGAGRGLRMEVVEECLHEPRPLSGPIALAELQDRYADVIGLAEALEQLRTIPGASPD